MDFLQKKLCMKLSILSITVKVCMSSCMRIGRKKCQDKRSRSVCESTCLYGYHYDGMIHTDFEKGENAGFRSCCLG